MKNVLIVCMVLVGLTNYAQRNNGDCINRADLTIEQIAELKTKKMTLKLDLNNDQQKEMKKLHLEYPNTSGNNRGPGKNRISSTEGYENEIQDLDSKIAFKKKVNSILTEAQYEKWDKRRVDNSRNKRPQRGRAN